VARVLGVSITGWENKEEWVKRNVVIVREVRKMKSESGDALDKFQNQKRYVHWILVFLALRKQTHRVGAVSPCVRR